MRMVNGVGIDVGTSNCTVAVVIDGAALAIPPFSSTAITAALAFAQTPDDPAKLAPSFVGVAEQGDWLVGLAAARQRVNRSAHTATGMKRLLGRAWTDAGVQDVAGSFCSTPSAGADGSACIDVGGIPRDPASLAELLFAEILRNTRALVEPFPEQCVLTVSPGFGEASIQALRSASQRAGWDVLDVMSEPEAAVVAYAIERGEVDGKETVAVVNVGAGTTHASFVEVQHARVEVTASEGEPFLGADELDTSFADWLLVQSNDDRGLAGVADRSARQRLRLAAQECRHALSRGEASTISLPFLMADARGQPVHVDQRVSREALERLAASWSERVLGVGARLRARMPGVQISRVLGLGGAIQMPLLARGIASVFAASVDDRFVRSPGVAKGAALRCAALRGKAPR